MRDTSSNIYNPLTNSQKFGNSKDDKNYDKTQNYASEDKTGKYLEQTIKNQKSIIFNSSATQLTNEYSKNFSNNTISNTTGALVIAGGVGIAKDLYVDGMIYGNITTGTPNNMFNKIGVCSDMTITN